MLKQYIKAGAVTERLPSILEIRNLCRIQVNMLPEKYRRLDNVPDSFPVVISDKLMNLSSDRFSQNE
jgi:hypothetical protein